MERGGLRPGLAAASVLLTVLLAAGPVWADAEKAPVQGGGGVSYQADAGALLAQARSWDPSFHLDFTFAHADIYDVFLPAPSPQDTRAAAGLAPPAPPAVLSARHVDAGSLTLDPRQGATVLLANDPRGLSVTSLPLDVPSDPARFVVDGALPLAQAVAEPRLDPHDLEVASSLHYTLQGLAVERPVAARAEGAVLAVLAGAPVQVMEGQNVYARDLAKGPTGERVLVVQAQGALVHVVAQGLTAVLQLPQASLGAGAALVADAEGHTLGTHQSAGVASGPQGVSVAQDDAVLGQVLVAPPARAAPGPGSAEPGRAYVPAGPAESLAGAALGGALALAALGAAAAFGAGKYGLLGLLAPLYARLSSADVLSNQTREAIYRFVVAHPGVNVSEVVKQFGLGWGATVYHLRVLERGHLVSASKQGRQVCYFQNGGRYHGQMAGISALRNGNAAFVARTILAAPGLQQREICRRTGLAQPTVSWHLQRLEQAGLVGADGAARKRYHPLPALHDLAARGFVEGYASSAAAASPASPTTVTTA